MIRIANAPCSWGALEFDLQQKPLGYRQVLEEMSETGYAGTELGDWGFMPTRPEDLKKALDEKKLQLLGAFVPVELANPAAHPEGVERALKTAGLMSKAGFPDAFIVLADNNGTVELRTKNAGRVTAAMSLGDEHWKHFGRGAETIAKAVRQGYGMRTVFHHHCAGYVETPAEVDRLMSVTDPSLIGLCLDTGHYSFGGGDPVRALDQYADRIWHVHFKDFDARIGEKSAQNSWNYFESVANGVFCELGKGQVKFREVLDRLKKINYEGWIVVEQDVLPGMGAPKKSAASNRKFLRSLGL